MIYCRRFAFDQGWVEVPAALSGPPLPANAQGVPLLYGDLSNRTWNGASFDCTQPGLYVFMNPGPPITSVYRIFSAQLGQTGFDFNALLTGLAEWCVIGDFDMAGTDPLNNAFNSALHRQPVITCETTCKFFQILLSKFNIPSRICRILTAGAVQPWLSYGDTGHVILEINTGSGWIVYDVLSDRHWNMSFADLITQINTPPFAWPQAAMFGSGKESPVNLTERSAYFKCLLGGSEASQLAWDNRIFGIPFIDNTSGQSIGYNPIGKSYQTTLPNGFSVLASELLFRNMFYT